MPEGAALARRLVEDADVVVQNFRAGKIDELGFGPAALADRRPDLVHASLNAFDFDGDWRHRPGWEHNAQAGTGMQTARARDGVPRHVPFPVNDYATGLLGAYGCLLALRHRHRTGGLLGAGESGPQRLQPPASARTDRPGRGLHPPAVRHRRGVVDGELPADLGSRAAGTDAAEAERLLTTAGHRAVREAGPADPALRAWLFASGRLTRWTHPVLGPLEQPTPHPVGGDLFRTDGRPAPQPGADTAEILAGLGLDADRVAALQACGAVAPERSFLDQSRPHLRR